MPIPHLNFAGSASAIGNLLLNLFEKKPEILQEVFSQQTAKWFETLDDEAIMSGLLPAVRIHYGTIINRVLGKISAAGDAERAFESLSDFVTNLESHQKIRLRRVLAKLTLTERYEEYVSKVVTDKNGTKTEHKDRRQIDYEYTADDQRVIFLALLAYDLQQPRIGEAGVKAQLLAWGTILDSTRLALMLDGIRKHGGNIRQWIVKTGLPKMDKGVQHALGMMLDPQTFQEFLDRYPHESEEEWEEVMKLFLSNQRVKTGDMKAGNARLRHANTWKAAFAGGPLWALVISAAIFLVCFGIWFANH